MKAARISSPILIPSFLYFIVFFLVAYQGFGQILECGSLEPTEQEIKQREAELRRLKRNQSQLQGSAVTFVPIRFHVVRRSNGTGGATLAQLNTTLAHVNTAYLQSGIQFYMAGSTPHYIDSDVYYDYDFSEEAALTAGNDVTNAINLYMVGTLSFQSGNVTGYAYYPSTLASSNRIFIRTDRVTDGRTLSHELGHYFNLLHTFHNNSNPDVSLRELVTRGSGANCTTAGDLVCDTPADPYGLINSTTSGCSYTGTVTDANGDLFVPSLVNMMSYYFLCGNQFTDGQYSRMEGGLVLRTAPANQYTLNYPAFTGVPGQVVANQTSAGVQVNFSDPGAGEGGFIIERATDPNGPYLAIAGLEANTTSYVDPSVITNTLYYYRVRASNGIQYSASDTAMVNLFYCKPTYSSACSPMIIADFVLSQSGTNLINNTNTGCGTNSYSDYSSIVATVNAGQSYSFTARAVTNGNGSFFPQHVSIWVDLNQNGVFEVSERLYQSSGGTTMSPTITGSITIPITATAGPTRMRIRSQYYTSGSVTEPCGQLSFGEAEDYTLHIQSTALAPTIQTVSVNAASVCPGQSLQVFFTTIGTFSSGNAYTVQIANASDNQFVSVPTTGSGSPLTAQFPANLPAGATYLVRVVASLPQTTGSTSAQQVLILPKVQAVLSGGGAVAAGDSATLTITRTSGNGPWQFTLSNSVTYFPNSQSEISINLAPASTTTYTLSSVQNTECGVGTGSGSATIVVHPIVATTLQIKVFMEGPYRTNTGQMITVLNQRGLLPGQTPVNTEVAPTPAGQPYGGSPWSYSGSEAVSNYQSNIVDWVLLSLRENSPSVDETVYRTAALVRTNGEVVLVGPPPELSAVKSYYVVIEHRNHLGVLSHQSVTVQNNVLSYDFTTQNSYTATVPVSIGQKQIGTIFAMHSADGNKTLPNQNFVINVNDYNLWTASNGQFDLYSPADFNMDAQISASDKIQWNANNSKFSMIGRQ